MDGRKFLLVRYEDMVTSPGEQLARVADFLNVDCSAEVLNRVIERSSASRMRKLEREESLDWQMTKSTRQDLAFVREAKVGSWRAGLTSSSVAVIESAWEPVMRILGYELSAQDCAAGATAAL